MSNTETRICRYITAATYTLYVCFRKPYRDAKYAEYCTDQENCTNDYMSNLQTFGKKVDNNDTDII